MGILGRGNGGMAQPSMWTQEASSKKMYGSLGLGNSVHVLYTFNSGPSQNLESVVS